MRNTDGPEASAGRRRTTWLHRREAAGQCPLPLATAPERPLAGRPPSPPTVPFTGRSPQSRHHSHQAAQRARAKDGSRTAAYLALLAAHGPLSDHAAAARLGFLLQTVNGIRNRTWIRPLVDEVGKTMSPNGSPCSTWDLRRKCDG
jgi:hypothetical protein